MRFFPLLAVICVLHGISIGLAIDLSSCADVRICAADTRMAVKEVDIGLAADIGTLSRLPKAVGSFSWVKEVCLSARAFGADEALKVGFVSQVLESKAAALEAALGLAGLIASKSPVAVQGTKELLNHARDHSVDESEFIPTTYLISEVHVADCQKQVCDTRPSGTRLCCSRTMSPRHSCRVSRRPSRVSRSFRHRPRPFIQHNPAPEDISPSSSLSATSSLPPVSS